MSVVPSLWYLELNKLDVLAKVESQAQGLALSDQGNLTVSAVIIQYNI